MNKKIIGIIALVVVALIIAGVSSKSKDNSPIKVGVSTILSGGWAAAGENMVNAAKLAVSEINSAGGINGRTIELVVEDAGFDSKTGLSAAQKLINVDKVRYIIGGTTSNGTIASAPLLNAKKVLYLTPVTGGSNVDNAGEYIFRIANSDLLAGRDIALAMKKLGFKRVGVIAETTEYTEDLRNSFEKTATEIGLNLVYSEKFQTDTTDFKTLVYKVKQAAPEAILVASQTGINGAKFIKQAKDIGLRVTYFSDFTFVVNEDAKKIVGSFDGVYFADPAYDSTSPLNEKFINDYKSKFNISPLIPFHAFSTYDGIKMLATAIEKVGDNSERVHDWLLKNVKNYHGLMGTYSINSNGNSDLGFVIKVVKDGKLIEIK